MSSGKGATGAKRRRRSEEKKSPEEDDDGIVLFDDEEGEESSAAVAQAPTKVAGPLQTVSEGGEEGESPQDANDGDDDGWARVEPRWKRACNRGDGEEVTIRAVFSPTHQSTVEQLRKALALAAVVNEIVTVAFFKAGVNSVICPEMVETGAGSLRIVKMRENPPNAIVCLKIEAEVTTLADDEQSVRINLKGLLHFLKSMDANDTVHLIKHRNEHPIRLEWSSASRPGRVDSVSIGQEADPLDTEQDDWSLASRKLETSHPSIRVQMPVAQLEKILAAARFSKAKGEEKSDLQKASSSGCAASFEVEFLRPVVDPHTSLRHLEFHFGVVYSVEMNTQFFSSYSAVETPCAERPESLIVDLCNTDAHLAAHTGDAPALLLCRQRFNVSQLQPIVHGMKESSPQNDVVEICFTLPDGLDWSKVFRSDFGRQPGRRWIAVPAIFRVWLPNATATLGLTPEVPPVDE